MNRNRKFDSLIQMLSSEGKHLRLQILAKAMKPWRDAWLKMSKEQRAGTGWVVIHDDACILNPDRTSALKLNRN
jgi:hypothetical protein